MQAFSFLHCADVHLGAPVRGLGKLPGRLREKLRDAPAEALARLVTTAINREVDAVIVAGDLFDADDRNLRAHAELREQLQHLDDVGIPSFVVTGNHDPLGALSTGVRLPESTYVFGPDVESVPLLREGVELARIYGVSYAKSATYENLAAAFPRNPDGDFTIGVLHTNVGDRAGHDPYAPCQLSDLTQTGFDYWALGHVHTRETLHSRTPIVHYPGNPQGLHTREPGARGATLVAVDESGHVELEPIWSDVARWHRVRTSIDDLEAIDELIGAFAEMAGAIRGSAPNRIHLVRWTLTGSGPLHAELNRPATELDLCHVLRAAQGIRAEGDPVWLERLDIATAATHDMDRLRNQQDYLGDMLRLAMEVRDAPPTPSAATVGDERPPVGDPGGVGAAVRVQLSELLDNPRLTRALGSDPWRALRWREIIDRAEALAIEHLAPTEADRP
ncbi:MAG TPA: DNA repair exonuclease [Acidobacteriota bacterium]|nr:DNA repair exonuclease [Acidobacteriota bacterium]